MYSEVIQERKRYITLAAEHLVRKIVDFGNHRSFLLRCMPAGITAVSVTLEKTVRTSSNFYIIRKAERQLVSERVRHY